MQVVVVVGAVCCACDKGGSSSACPFPEMVADVLAACACVDACVDACVSCVWSVCCVSCAECVLSWRKVCGTKQRDLVLIWCAGVGANFKPFPQIAKITHFNNKKKSLVC